MDSFVPPLFAQANKDNHSDTIDRLIEAGKTSSLKAVIAYTEAMRDRKDRMEVWKNFAGKKLMIAGEMDMAIPLENSRLHQSSADLYHELQGVGHMGMYEAKNTSISILESFLADM